MRRLPGILMLYAVAACGGSGSDSSNLPPDAEEMQTYLRTGVTVIMPRLGGAGAVLIFALNPGSPGATGIQFDPDLSPGAPPNSYTFSGAFDGDGDGTDETTFTGSGTFTGDPATASVGFGGDVVLTMDSEDGLGTLTGDLSFVLTAADGRGELSGTGSFSEVVTGNTTTVSVGAGTPLEIKPATGAASSVANACASSLNGDLQVDVAGPTGSMSSKWGFSNNRKTAAVTGASFTDGNNTVTDIPDANVTIPCGQNGSTSDWTGEFLQNYACVPLEFGSATLTLSVASGSRISITDEDPPASGDFATYEADVVSGNPHVLRGFFIAGPAGFTYREDFSWILAPDGNSFSQISSYVFQEGPNQGSGGFCGGQATLVP